MMYDNQRITKHEDLYRWLGAAAPAVWQDHLIEQAAREAEAMRHLAEQIEE